jgi:hypothetical protein
MQIKVQDLDILSWVSGNFTEYMPKIIEGEKEHGVPGVGLADKM